jgi:phage-related protein
MRLQERDGIARALYLTASGRRVVILRVFAKKIELAQQCAKGVA